MDKDLYRIDSWESNGQVKGQYKIYFPLIPALYTSKDTDYKKLLALRVWVIFKPQFQTGTIPYGPHGTNCVCFDFGEGGETRKETDVKDLVKQSMNHGNSENVGSEGNITCYGVLNLRVLVRDINLKPSPWRNSWDNGRNIKSSCSILDNS